MSSEEVDSLSDCSSYDSYDEDALESSCELDRDDEEDLGEAEEASVSPLPGPSTSQVSPATSLGKRKKTQRASHGKRVKFSPSEEGSTEWREHHNQQERRRRDTLGGHFSRLAYAVGLPKTASRLQVLERTSEGLLHVEKAKQAMAEHEAAFEAAQADLARGIKKSPAILRAALTSYEDTVLPHVYRSMFLNPRRMTPDLHAQMTREYQRNLARGMSGHDAIFSALPKLRELCPLHGEGEEEEEGEEEQPPPAGNNAYGKDDLLCSDDDSWTTEDFNITEAELDEAMKEDEKNGGKLRMHEDAIKEIKREFGDGVKVERQEGRGWVVESVTTGYVFVLADDGAVYDLNDGETTAPESDLDEMGDAELAGQGAAADGDGDGDSEESDEDLSEEKVVPKAELSDALAYASVKQEDKDVEVDKWIQSALNVDIMDNFSQLGTLNGFDEGTNGDTAHFDVKNEDRKPDVKPEVAAMYHANDPQEQEGENFETKILEEFGVGQESEMWASLQVTKADPFTLGFD